MTAKKLVGTEIYSALAQGVVDANQKMVESMANPPVVTWECEVQWFRDARAATRAWKWTVTESSNVAPIAKKYMTNWAINEQQAVEAAEAHIASRKQDIALERANVIKSRASRKTWAVIATAADLDEPNV